MAINNRQISRLFKLGAQLLELHGENQFKIRSYENAAFRLRTINQPLAEMSEGALEEIEGIGAALAKKIIQIRDTGSYPELDNLLELTPPGLIELLNVKGIGAKKIQTAWKELGVSDSSDLLKACEEGKIARLKGFGEKTQQNLLETLLYYFESKGKYLYAEAEQESIPLLDALGKNPQVKNASLTGEVRRKNLVVERIELLIEKGDGYNEKAVMDSTGLVEYQGDKLVTSEFSIPVDVYYADEKAWIEQLILTTGTNEHVSQLKQGALKDARSEEEAYQKSGFPFIIPEMRENADEFGIMSKIRQEDIITYEKICGCLHNHSTYSDGANTIEKMAGRCQELGLQYFGISDHSQTAVYAGGLKPEKVIKQWKEVDKLNIKLAPFKIFKGIESDILGNGALDYDDEILSGFDYVVASVHSSLKMKEDAATARLIKAIENPYTTILGHMTARLLLMRTGFPVDHQKVIDACAANNVIIEINANPRRLDMDWRWINYAVEKGVMLSINPDAHSLGEIENMYFGVCAGRKGGLTHDRVLNTLPLGEVDRIFQQKKSTK